jgi:hypothetical protein
MSLGSPRFIGLCAARSNVSMKGPPETALKGGPETALNVSRNTTLPHPETALKALWRNLQNPIFFDETDIQTLTKSWLVLKPRSGWNRRMEGEWKANGRRMEGEWKAVANCYHLSCECKPAGDANARAIRALSPLHGSFITKHALKHMVFH